MKGRENYETQGGYLITDRNNFLVHNMSQVHAHRSNEGIAVISKPMAVSSGMGGMCFIVGGK